MQGNLHYIKIYHSAFINLFISTRLGNLTRRRMDGFSLLFFVGLAILFGLSRLDVGPEAELGWSLWNRSRRGMII